LNPAELKRALAAKLDLLHQAYKTKSLKVDEKEKAEIFRLGFYMTQPV